MMTSALLGLVACWSDPINQEDVVAPSIEEVSLEALGGACCKVCTLGKACGDACIADDRTCHVGPGCACNASMNSGGGDDELNVDCGPVDALDSDCRPNRPLPQCTGRLCLFDETCFGGSVLAYPGPACIPDVGDFCGQSFFKRDDTRRFEMWSGPNFTGSCTVVGPHGGPHRVSQLPFSPRSFRTLPKGQPPCQIGTTCM